MPKFWLQHAKNYLLRTNIPNGSPKPQTKCLKQYRVKTIRPVLAGYGGENLNTPFSQLEDKAENSRNMKTCVDAPYAIGY